MKKMIFTTLLVGSIALSNLFAQKPEANIYKILAANAPILDGNIDSIWNNVAKNDFTRKFGDENPTIGEVGESYWKAVWDDANLYVLVVVKDNVFFPVYKARPERQDAKWAYEKAEVYLDVNAVLEDGKGPIDGAGHYQYAPAFEEGKISGELQDKGSYLCAMRVNDPEWIVEFQIKFSEITDMDGLEFDPTIPIGFDITIVDTDNDDAPEVQLNRQRAVWANTGEKNESFFNMDDCGIINLKSTLLSAPQMFKSSTFRMKIYNDNIFLSGLRNNSIIEIYDIRGVLVHKQTMQEEGIINLTNLRKKGVYLLREVNSSNAIKFVY